jgi:CO/xanthine dehydrogenase Mo-binding subunit
MEAPCFVTDIYLPQMLYALTIRSPVAKGRLLSIECPKLPGSCTLVTAREKPSKNSLEDTAIPVLAGDELSYIGEPVALLLGPDKNTLEDYSRLCRVIAQEETPFFYPGEVNADRIAASREMRIGDPETAFAQAASIVRGNYTGGIQEHWYAEPTGAVAWIDEADASKQPSKSAVIVRTATQWPFHVRRSVAQVLGLAGSKVLVKPAITGLHLDGKLWYPSLVSCHAALGAWITKRPVRLVLTRAEDFAFSPKRCETEISIANALNEKGEITGTEIKTAVNLGAYEVNGAEILDHVNLGSLGVYKTKNIRLSGVAFKSNIPPQGPFAGFGLAQGFFAMECHVSRVADTLKQDPAQWRIENGIKNGTLPPGMPVKDAPAPQQLIETVVQMSDYRRKWASYELLRQNRSRRLSQDSPPGYGREENESPRGIGIALGYQGNGFLYHGNDKGYYGIELILDKDGTLEINTSMAGSGADSGGMWADIASNILGIDREMVRINGGPDSPDSGPLTLSRTITVLAKLVEQACQVIGKKRFRAPLPISVRKTVRPSPNPAWDACFPPLRGAPDHNGFTRPGWASAIVEVEIDPVEYIPRIRGIWMSVDGGKIIAEDNARKSLRESAMQALGWAHREQINYDHGAIPVKQYDNFDIPNPAEIPPITIDFIRGDHHEPKGIGDLPFTCIPAAYAQAVSQALDSHFQSIPLKEIDIWYASNKKNLKKEGPA